jgi:mRNA interferase MazF
MIRGEIWEVNLDPTIGAEIRIKRPCIIVNRDVFARLPLKIVVPLTAWDERFSDAPWHVRVSPTRKNGLAKESSADTFQVRSISEKRLVKKLGVLDPAHLKEIDRGLALSLDLHY